MPRRDRTTMAQRIVAAATCIVAWAATGCVEPQCDHAPDAVFERAMDMGCWGEAAANIIPDDEQRCRELISDLQACAQIETLPLNCNSFSPGDLENLETALDTVGCNLLIQRLPVDGDGLAASCRLFGDGCVDAVNAPPSGPATRYPVVLVNGIDVSILFSWSERIVDVLEREGHRPQLAVLPPYDAPPRRAQVLWRRIQEILDDTGAEKVNLVCHSLGGLDCRYLLSPNGLAWEVSATHSEIVAAVASVTTVATAHRGTPIADEALGFLPGGNAERAAARLATSLGGWFSGEAIATDVELRASLAALSQSQARAFNAQIVDAGGVFYQSWGGFSRPGGEALESDADRAILREACAADPSLDTDGPLNGLVSYRGADDHLAIPLVDSYPSTSKDAAGDFTPSDGLCPVTSSKWGLFRGCVPIDHMEQLGRRNLPDANVRNGFDVAWFYAAVASDLAERGY